MVHWHMALAVLDEAIACGGNELEQGLRTILIHFCDDLTRPYLFLRSLSPEPCVLVLGLQLRWLRMASADVESIATLQRLIVPTCIL